MTNYKEWNKFSNNRLLFFDEITGQTRNDNKKCEIRTHEFQDLMKPRRNDTEVVPYTETLKF